MEVLATILKILTGTTEQATPEPRRHESYDGKVFDNPDDLEEYEEAKVQKDAKYVLSNDPIYGTLYWSGRGRKPKWVEDFENKGGKLEDIEVKR